MNKKKLSFVIPCYGSEKTIDSVVYEIKDTIKKIDKFSYEIILVCDNSPDNVWEVIKQLSIDDNNIKALELSKNFGQHAALMAGYKKCTGDYIVSLDDDGQTPANEISKLINKLEEGFDVVYAQYAQKKHSLFRNLGSKINDFMVRKLLNKSKNLFISSFFITKKYIINEILNYENSYPYLPGLVLRVTKNIANVNVNHREREVGCSGYTFSKLVGLWLNGFTAFSIKPLRIASAVGTICASCGFLYGLYVIVKKFLDPSIVMGYSSLMAVLLFIGGMLMLMLGLIGEYIGRIYISINNSPQYVIKETINLD